MKKIFIAFYNIFVLTFYRLFGLKIAASSYIGFGKHLKGCRFIRVGKNSRIRRGVTINCYKNYRGQKLNPSLKVGNNVYINTGFLCLVTNSITIKDDVTIGPNVSVMSHNHGLDPEKESYLDNELITKPVIIEQGVWIGDKAIILPGVTIGEKTIIGAGSVVTKSIDGYCIAAGNPCRVLKRYNFEKKTWEKVNE